MKLKQSGLILFIILLLVLSVPITTFAEEQPAKIADVALKNVLRGMLNKGVYDDVYPSELEQFTGEMDFSNMGITDLRGLENFKNVTSFNFSHNQITRLPSNLILMENLEVLNLSFNDLRTLDGNIAYATSLKELNLAGNKLTELPSRIQEMAGLRVLDISGNRFETLPHRLIYLHLTDFNCNYNFIDFSSGTISRKDLDNMDVSGQLQAYKQLVKLPKITYETDNGNFIIKWREMYDVPFYDGTSATVVGYTVFFDGKFQKTVGPDETEYDVGFVDSGTYRVSVAPDYKVEGFGEFPIRVYTTLPGATYGQDGPFIPENTPPEAFVPPNGAVVETGDTDATMEPMLTASDVPMATNADGSMGLVTWILIAVVALLAAGLTTMLVLFLRKKPEQKTKAKK